MFKTLFLAAVASMAGLALTSNAHAAGFYSTPGVVAGRPYHTGAGVRYAGGYYYPGRHHSHWGSRVWSPRYHRYHYWDPHLKCHYYWCRSRGCYLPIGAPFPY